MSLSTLFVSALSLLSAVQAAPARARRSVPQGATIARPGGINDVWITKDNTLNGTSRRGPAPADVPAGGPLSINVNNFLGDGYNAYIQGLDSTNQVVFVNSANQFYYPTTSSSTPVAIDDGSIAIPIGGSGSSTPVTIPNNIISARMYFSKGPLQFFVVATGSGPGLVQPAPANAQDPNAATEYGFVELNWATNNLFGNIGNVDYIGIPIGMSLSVNDGSPEQHAYGLPSNGVSSVCSSLQGQAQTDGQAWDSECVYDSNGNLVRVIAPPLAIGQDSSRFTTYFDGYVNQVLSQFASQPLNIDTQAAAGVVQCSSDPNGRTITCQGGDNRNYAAPNSNDIFGCNSGPFAIMDGDNDAHKAIVPRLCAAFNRGTYLIPGGDSQPGPDPSTYYGIDPTNYYSKFVHGIEWNGLGYAFSYDDVTPSNSGNVAGVVSSGSVNTLTVIVGGYDLAGLS